VTEGRIDGFEALVRWVEPNGVVHMPGSFIAVAGELGLLGNVTQFVLEDIVADLPRLKERFGPDVTVSINVTAHQINSPDFTRRLLAYIRVTGIGRNLIVELTEDAFVSAHSVQRALPELREMGVRISIDDFGTGFSSLSTLADIDADEIKVDRAFITAIHERPRSQDILKAIESVCKALEINMVAEGVETFQELEYLVNRSGIRVFQGFFFGKPVFIDETLTRGFGCDWSIRSARHLSETVAQRRPATETAPAEPQLQRGAAR
jgi:EAL domain-containing protein (putative c-di-GMP-specific phosphodiesterase class I)